MLLATGELTVISVLNQPHQCFRAARLTLLCSAMIWHLVAYCVLSIDGYEPCEVHVRILVWLLCTWLQACEVCQETTGGRLRHLLQGQ